MFIKTLISCLSLLSASSIIAGNSVKLSGVDFSVDTLFHAKIGPGTTQTSLRLINKVNPKQQLRAFYVTADLENPAVGLESLVANDKLAGTGTVSSMAKSHSSDSHVYYAGINTDFFEVRGTASNGVSIVGTPVRSVISGGEIYRTADATSAWPQFYVDSEGKPSIGAVSFDGGTASCNGTTVKFSIVNNTIQDGTAIVNYIVAKWHVVCFNSYEEEMS